MAQTADTNPVLTAFQRIRHRLRQMSARLMGDDDDAEDALQDAFVKLWVRRADIHSSDEAAAIMTAMVRNLSIDQIRRRTKITEVELDPNRDGFFDDSADLQAEINERYLQVQHIIASRLTEVQQRILQMRDYEGRSYDEIAKTLHMQPPNVRMQLSRARKTVRDVYWEQHSYKQNYNEDSRY